jgi:hypothetical protein
MTRSLAVAPCVMLLSTLVSSPALAQTSGTTIPAVAKVGMHVSIVDDQGDEVEGRIDNVSDRAVRIIVKKDRKEIPLDSIVRIERPDGVKNGAMIGLGIGIGMGLTAGFADRQSWNRQPGFVTISVIGNGLVWTGLGTMFDAMINHRRTLYERGGRSQARVTPVVGRGTAGAAVSLTW